MPLGQPGEIAIRGPQVMAGYWQRPDETAKVMTPDGFFKSGDIGIMDERGYIRIVDRKKDMILVSGFNVYPNEIEQVITTHPGRASSAPPSACPTSSSGEAVKVFVVRKDPALTDEQLMEFCKRATSRATRSRSTSSSATSCRRRNVGKILRRELRDAAVAAAQARSA